MDHFKGAPGAGPITPTSDETSGTAGTDRGLKDQETTRTEYAAGLSGIATATASIPPRHAVSVSGASDVDRKRFATMQARAALAGVALSAIEDDRGHQVFIASKWAMTKELATLDDVEQLLVRIGGSSAV